MNWAIDRKLERDMRVDSMEINEIENPETGTGNWDSYYDNGQNTYTLDDWPKAIEAVSWNISKGWMD